MDGPVEFTAIQRVSLFCLLCVAVLPLSLIHIFSGMCEHFPATYEGADLKSPHVGWNSLEQIRPDSRLLRGVADGAFVYFTHSWRAPVVQETAAVTNYGGAFTAALERENVMGVQFHPEKSADVGLRVLRNFVEL